MSDWREVYDGIVCELTRKGATSAYRQDADEPDPGYQSYGVRAPQVKDTHDRYAKEIRGWPVSDQIALAERLVTSGFGEQQTIALNVLERHTNEFAERGPEFTEWVFRKLLGWSKVDAFTGRLLSRLLVAQKELYLPVIEGWSRDPSMWMRRASIAVFTRKLAKSGFEIDFALEQCDRLKSDPERLVLTAVGWSLKDYLVFDQSRVLDRLRFYENQGVSGIVLRYAMRGLPASQKRKKLTPR